MCFDLPSKVIAIENNKATVKCGSHCHNVKLELLRNVKVGDYVMIQGDYAISKIAKKDVEEILELLKSKNKGGKK